MVAGRTAHDPARQAIAIHAHALSTSACTVIHMQS